MERIKKFLKHYLLNEKYLIQVYNYKLAIYRHEQCERTTQMHLFNLEKRDFSLMVLFSVAFTLLSFMWAPFWPNPMDYQASESRVFQPKTSPYSEQITVGLHLIKNETVEFVETNQELRNEFQLTSNDCSDRDLAIMSRVELEFEIDQSETLDVRFAFKLEWNIISYSISDADNQELGQFAREPDMGSSSNELPFFDEQTKAHGLSLMIECKSDDEFANNNNNSVALIKCFSPDIHVRDLIGRGSDGSARFLSFSHKIKISLKQIKLARKGKTNLNGAFKLKSVSLSNEIGYLNSNFKALVASTRWSFLVASILLSLCFLACLKKYKFSNWSIEQQSTIVQLMLLVLINKSYFLSEDNDFEFQLATPFKLNRSSLVESLADTTFLCSMLLSWLIFAHSVRQISRPFYQFYLAKVALVAGIFITTNSTLLIDYLDLTVKLASIRCLSILFYSTWLIYFVAFAYYFILATIELRPISYLKLRFNIQSIMIIWLVANYFMIIISQQSPAANLGSVLSANQTTVVADSTLHIAERDKAKLSRTSLSAYSIAQMLKHLPQQHSYDSARTFLHQTFVNNLYVLTSVYLYWPMANNEAIVNIK